MAIKLSDLARQDLDDVRRYTIETWGRDQWLSYYRRLVTAFELIEVNPTAGRNRDLFRKGTRSINYEKHIIFFAPVEAAGGAPVILRILHQRRHLPALVYYEDLDS